MSALPPAPEADNSRALAIAEPERALLANYAQALSLIEAAATVPEAAHNVDMTSRLRTYATKVAKDHEMALRFREFHLRAQFKLGQLLIAEQAAGRLKKPGRPWGKIKIPNGIFISNTYKEIGIDGKTGALSKRMARLGASALEARIARLQKGAPNALQSSQSEEWYSPKNVLDRVVMTLGAIDLDPCAEEPKNGVHNVPAIHHITKAENGLAHPWRGAVYMNPPYGFQVDDWCEKLLHEYRDGGVTSAVALLAARTDTRWWRLFKHAPACFVSGRLRFSDTNLHAPFPSAIFYLGADKGRFVASFAALGEIRDAAIAG